MKIDSTAKGNWLSKMKVSEGMKNDKAGSEIQTEFQGSYRRNSQRDSMKTKFSTQKKGSGWDIKIELPEDMA